MISGSVATSDAKAALGPLGPSGTRSGNFFSGAASWILNSESTSAGDRNIQAFLVSDRPRFEADLELAKNVIRQNNDAFVQLIKTHQEAVRRIVNRYTMVPSEQEELVGDTFSEVFISLKNFRGESSLRSWVSTIATRQCFRLLRKKQREQVRKGLLQTFGLSRSEEERQPDSQIDTPRLHLEKVLRRLSPEDRMVLTLMYWEGCTVAEAAGRMNWKPSKVKVRAFRARQKLKTYLEGFQDE